MQSAFDFNSDLLGFFLKCNLCYNECVVEPYLKDLLNQIVLHTEECNYDVSDMDSWTWVLIHVSSSIDLGLQLTIPNQHTDMLC